MNEQNKVKVEGEQRIVPLAHFPSGADGTEPAEEKTNWLEFCRLKLERIGAAGQTSTFIGKRVNASEKSNPSQIFEIKVRRSNDVFPATATCTENGELLFKLEGSVSFHQTEYAAVKALKAILQDREYKNRDHNRRRRLRRAAKRAAAAQAIINKELA